MDDWHLSTYLRKLVSQADRAAAAKKALRSALIGDPLNGGRRSTEKVFAAAQDLTSSAVLVARLCWADTQREWTVERREFALDRAARVREVVNPPDILTKRPVRNSLEHFDARLDEVLFGDPSAGVIDKNSSVSRGFA